MNRRLPWTKSDIRRIVPVGDWAGEWSESDCVNQVVSSNQFDRLTLFCRMRAWARIMSPVTASIALVGLATFGASVCSETERRRLRRQVRKSFELKFDLNRRKTAPLVRPAFERKRREEFPTKGGRTSGRSSGRLRARSGAKLLSMCRRRRELICPMQKDAMSVARPTAHARIDNSAKHSSQRSRSARSRLPIKIF